MSGKDNSAEERYRAEIKIKREYVFAFIKHHLELERPIKVRDLVLYKPHGGEVHYSPFMVVEHDTRTALIRGKLADLVHAVELRVNRSEIIRYDDVEEIIKRILESTHSCPSCIGNNTTRQAGQEEPRKRRDN